MDSVHCSNCGCSHAMCICSCDECNEKDTRIAELEAKLEMLRQDEEAYNTESVLRHLIDAAKYLLNDLDCDQDGYEHWQAAYTAGEHILQVWADNEYPDVAKGD